MDATPPSPPIQVPGLDVSLPPLHLSAALDNFCPSLQPQTPPRPTPPTASKRLRAAYWTRTELTHLLHALAMAGPHLHIAAALVSTRTPETCRKQLRAIAERIRVIAPSTSSVNPAMSLSKASCARIILEHHALPPPTAPTAPPLSMWRVQRATHKLVVQVTPSCAADAQVVERAGHNARVEVVLRANRTLWRVVHHLYVKWNHPLLLLTPDGVPLHVGDSILHLAKSLARPHQPRVLHVQFRLLVLRVDWNVMSQSARSSDGEADCDRGNKKNMTTQQHVPTHNKPQTPTQTHMPSDSNKQLTTIRRPNRTYAPPARVGISYPFGPPRPTPVPPSPATPTQRTRTIHESASISTPSHTPVSKKRRRISPPTPSSPGRSISHASPTRAPSRPQGAAVLARLKGRLDALAAHGTAGDGSGSGSGSPVRCEVAGDGDGSGGVEGCEVEGVLEEARSISGAFVKYSPEGSVNSLPRLSESLLGTPIFAHSRGRGCAMGADGEKTPQQGFLLSHDNALDVGALSFFPDVSPRPFNANCTGLDMPLHVTSSHSTPFPQLLRPSLTLDGSE